MRYRISGFFNLGGKSILCFPYFRRVDKNDNYSYIWLQDRNLKIVRFLIAEADGMLPIYPSRVEPPGFLFVDFQEGERSAVPVYNSMKDVIYFVTRDDYRSVLSNSFSSFKNSYDFYYISSLFDEDGARLELLKKEISRPMTNAWRAAETRYVQKKKFYWDSIESIRSPKNDYPSLTLQDYLSEFNSPSKLIDWIERERITDDLHDRSKWALLFNFSYINGILDEDRARIFATDFLIKIGVRDRNFQVVFKCMRGQYEKGHMYDLREYVVDYIEEAREIAAIMSYAEMYGLFSFLESLVYGDHGGGGAKRFNQNYVLDALSDLLEDEKLEPTRSSEIDPYGVESIVETVVYLSENARKFVGLSVQMVCFAHYVTGTEVANRTAQNYLRYRLVQVLDGWIIEALRDGIPFSDPKFMRRLHKIYEKWEKRRVETKFR